MTATAETRHVEPGDIVETSSRHVGAPGRRGEIVAVRGQGANHYYLVHWEDGHESILYPGEAMTIRRGERGAVGWAD